MANQSKRNFKGGLDLDSNIKDILPENYLYALNVINGTSNRNKGKVVQNTAGNRLVSYTLPTGNNKVIGFFEDKKEASGIYFVYNDAGNHSILRYYPDTNLVVNILEESVLNFKDFPIVTINLVDNLLSWTTGDGNPPREFNIERAQRQDKNGVFKKVKFNLYFDFLSVSAFINGDNYNLTYTDSSGNPQSVLVYEEIPLPPSGLSPIELFVQGFNAAQSDFTATSCGQFVEVEGNFPQMYDVNIVANPNTVTGLPSLSAVRVFTNIYPDAFLETFINADRNPPICEPTITLKTDANINTNFIVSKIFQFRLAYRYVDNEKSSLSPISTVSIGVGNYIEIDFTDSRLNDENLTIIKNVELYVKEGELGKWKLIDSLDRFEFGYNPLFPTGTNYFKFYNDKAYNVVDDAYAIKLFESFPIEAEAQEVAANRKMYGGITEGYDQECVDLSLSVAYKKPPQLYTIKGIVVIRPLFGIQNGETAFDNNTAIFTQAGGYRYGGLFDIGQNIPLVGFTFYLAGTSFYGVSKQKITNGGIHQDANGAYFPVGLPLLSYIYTQNHLPYDAFKSSDPYNLTPDAIDQYGAYIGDKFFGGTTHGSDIYSTFEITGVPAGRYILRIAGCETTQSQLSTTDYQKSSGYTIAVGNAATFVSGTPPQGFEYEIEVGATTIAYYNAANPSGVQAQNNNNVIYVGCSAVADLTFPTGTLLSRTIVSGYVCDSDLTTVPTTYDGILSDTRIERALVKFSQPQLPPFPYASSIPPNWSQRAWNDLKAVTDHNGFFWYVAATVGTTIDSVVSGATTNYSITLAQGFKEDNSAITFSTVYSGYIRIALRNSNTNIKTLSRTYVHGRILDGTSPREDVPVILSLGGALRTDNFGEFSIPYYADTFYNAYGGGARTRIGYAIFSSADNNIVYDFAPANDRIFIGVPFSGIEIDVPNYNNVDASIMSKWYLLNDIQADLLEEFISISAWKRGCNTTFGVIYYDRENRQTTVQEHIQELYVPFYTENNTAGFAQISWAISSLPPDWATHYQVVRVHNVPSFVQFNAKNITIIGNTKIRIDTTTFIDYDTRYPNANISYIWQANDRIRFISNGGGNLFNEYFDAEIVFQNPPGDYIEIEYNNIIASALTTNTLFEIYTPKPSEQTLFYEFGECYEIYEDNGVKYHRGQSQDQTAVQNAEGTFQTGNVYYRFRNFVLGGARYIEDSAVSDFYESFTTQTGRPQILDKNAKQVVRPTLIRISNPYFSGSQTNGFASFEALNQKELDRVFGTIQVMELMAQSVLLVVCQQRTQTFYINKATINIPSNTPNLISLSDAVLNQADTLIGEWGTQHRSSFASYNNNAWWWDKSKGQMIRYSSNGLFPVSDYGAKSYFKDKGITNDTFVSAGYDPYFSNYFITLGSETIAFNDGAEGGKNLWTSFFSFLPECYGRIDNLVLMFKDGSLYAHDSATRNNFFGVQYASVIETSVNDSPSIEKIFQSVALEGKDVWHLPIIRTNEGSTYPNGMLSRLLRTDFKRKNNMWFADLKGNMLDPYVTSQLDGLINGEKLRGEVCVMRFQNDLNTYSELYSVDIYSTISMRTPV